MPPLYPPSLSPPRLAPAHRQLRACVGLSLYPEAALADLLLGLPLGSPSRDNPPPQPLLGAHEEGPRPLEWRSPPHTSVPSPGSFIAEGRPLAPGPKVQGKAAPVLPPPLSVPPPIVTTVQPPSHSPRLRSQPRPPLPCRPRPLLFQDGSCEDPQGGSPPSLLRWRIGFNLFANSDWERLPGALGGEGS